MLVEAFTKVPIINRFPEQITAMDSSGNLLMLGTRQGNVNVYTVIPNETDSREFKVKVLHVIKLRKPIVQLQILPVLDCVLVLSDHVISVYDTRTFKLVQVLKETRGAVTFTVDQTSLSASSDSMDSSRDDFNRSERGILRTRLAVSLRRRVVTFETLSGWNALKESKNLLITDARVLLFFGDALYVATRTDYMAVRLSNCEIFDLFLVGASEPGIFLIAADALGFLQDHKMAIVSPRSDARKSPTEYSRVVSKISWTEPPSCVLPAAWPYILALLPSCLEVRVRDSRQLVQQEMLDRPRHLCPQAVHPGPHAPSTGFPEAAGSRRQSTSSLNSLHNGASRVRGRTNSSVTGPQAPVTAIGVSAIYVASNDHVWRLVGVDRVRQIQQLMERKEYDLAWQLSGTVPVPEALERVMPLFDIGTLHAFTLFTRDHRFEDALAIFSDLRVDPTHVVGLLRGGLLPEEFQAKIQYPGELPRFNEDRNHKAMTAMVPYLLTQRNIINVSGADPNYRPITHGCISISSRAHLRQVIDTSLFKCYLYTKKDTLLESFLRLPDNSCHFEETEHTLKSQNRYKDLLVLYENRGDHRKALKFLLAQSQKAGSALFGPKPTIRYLQKLGPKHWDVICEFAKWVLERHPDQALSIFTDYASDPLPRRKVYEYLRVAAPRLVIQYLEHVIALSEEEADMSLEERARFNNILGDELIQQAKALTEESVRGLPEAQQALLSPSGSKIHADPSVRQELESIRQRLQHFLESSSLYSPRKLLTNYPMDFYFEERAMLYARMPDRLRDALALWLHVLNQPEKAEQVALRAFEEGKSAEEKAAFLLLLEVCLQPPTPARLEVVWPPLCGQSSLEAERASSRPFPVRLDYGLNVLRRFGARIDAARGVALLPESVSLAEVLPYLKTALEAKERKRRNQTLQRQLCYAELLQQEHRRITLRCRRLELSADDTCSVCRKRLGANSAFGRHPDGRVAHYACCQQLNA